MSICLLGLSNSGKTCYLYTASYVLSQGIDINGCKISVSCTNLQQKLRLNAGIEDVVGGMWPNNTGGTTTFPYELTIDGNPVTQFSIYDYRGGTLDGMTDNDQDEFEDLLDAFEGANCVIVFVDGDTILSALDPKDVSPQHRKNVAFVEQTRALNKLNYVESLLRECYQRVQNDAPVLLVITKSDLFYEDELIKGTELLRRCTPILFSKGNDRIVGITSVSLGENLVNNNGRLEGTLCLNTEGNVHLPILFALLHDLDEDKYGIDEDKAKMLIRELFTNDKISFYRNGRNAFLIL